MSENKEEVVISGIGGQFPECNNMEELKELLFNKTNGVTVDSRRWRPNEIIGIDGTGKLKNIDKFDATFFSAHPKLAESMDPLTRICLERSIEAIIDAGLSPSDLYGTNTAVFTGSAISATEIYTMDCTKKNSAFSMLGRSRTMQANRVSYILNLTGPSFSMDGGWICGANGLEKAKKMIESGIISSAIVGVTGLVLRPELQLQFKGLNRLNKSIETKSFSNDADGYNRSEACIVMLLQRASEAKRSYGTLLSVKSVQFGDHQGHLTEHVGNNFKSLLLDSYKEANVDPASVEFIEAYGSGIKSEDDMELNIMEEVFCTEKRKTPLKVGSIKSNIGHCEVSGHFISIVKAIIALESGYIPPNINYTEPNENVAALKNGKIQVVTEKTPLVTDLVGISSFGVLNAFSHVIIRKNSKVQDNSKDISSEDHIPLLILASGRNEENVRKTVEKIRSYGNNFEFVTLTNNVFSKNISSHFYRSFSIFPNPDKSQINDVWNVNLKKRPVWFIFSGMGSQWQGMGTDLMKLPVFADAINKCDTILKPLGVDIKNILTDQNPKLFDNILNSFVGIAAVQIGLVEVLKALDIIPDGIIGHSVGELGCAYADGCFTAEEMILAAYSRGRASIETEMIPGMMAAIGLGYDQVKHKLPHDIDVACRNSATSCTISGPEDSIIAFVSKLSSQGIFAKAVNVAGIAFHSRYIKSAGPTLLKYLKEVIKVPKIRSSKWVSSSLTETEWESDLAKYSSAEYHTNNLLSNVFFEDVLKHIPSDAITIEIAPHGLLQAIIKGALPDTVTNIPLTKRVFGDSIRFLLTAVGKMYASGLNPKIQNIYPPIKFPVARGTPHIHSLPFWDHTDQWIPTVAKNENFLPSEKTGSILLKDDIYLMEYRIHGYHIIPFSYVLINVWKMYVEMFSKNISEEPVKFYNLQFKNNVEIHPTNLSEFYIMIQRGSGLFEYSLENEVIFSGNISFINNLDLNVKQENSKMIDKTSDDFQRCVSQKELYEVLKNNGYNLGDKFKNIMNFDVYKNNIQGSVKWENDWIYFLEGLLKFPLLENVGTCQSETPVSIRQIIIIPTVFDKCTIKDININYNIITNEITCNGIQICDVKSKPIIISKLKSAEIKLEEQQFIPFNYSNIKNISDIIYDFMNIITESYKINFDNTSGKLVLYRPFDFDDPLSKSCIKSIEKIIENQISYDCMKLNWNNVDKISENCESEKFITVTNVNCLQDTIKSLANIKYSYIILCSIKKPQDLKDWKIITQQKFSNDGYLSLIKKAIIRNGESKFVKPINDRYDLSIWKALETCDSSTNMIYIISKNEPPEGITTYVKEMLHKYRSNKLRFVFILDSNAPDFDSHQSFYTDQLSKDLIVNIYKNGGWGFYKRIVLQDLKDDVKVNNSLVFQNCITNIKSKLAVKYLGLNFKDLVVEENTENKFGPWEYSGHIDDKTTMGITSINEISSQMIYDPLLSWPVPSTWSLDEATTVPLAYAMCYYVFNILCKLQKNNSILVTSGLHPIGQAAISISLDMKCDTYAIVDSDQQAEQLSCIFPELSRTKILINTNGNFDVELNMITKSKGVDIIFNFLNGNAFQAAIRTLAMSGNFFNFSKSDMQNHRSLGTRIFLKNTSFFAITSRMLLNESVYNKQIVQQAFLDGLYKGVIKPFHSLVLTPPFRIEPILDNMRDALATWNKIVLSLSDEAVNSKIFFEHDSHQFNPDHIYVVVGNKSDWLDVAEWLVDRGAQKIVIVVKCCLMASTTYRRFEKLISRNISIQIESFSYLKTKQESLEWLTRLASSNVLGSLFVVNQHDDKIINNLRNTFEDFSNKTNITWFICIASKGEHICAELKSNGLNGLNLLWDRNSTQSNNTDKLLIALDNLLRKSTTIVSSSFICSESAANKLEWSHQINDVIANCFPGSTEELHLLHDKITKEAEFIEVPTRSPRSSQMKFVTPVFVIPGLKPKLIESFYKQFFYPVFEAQYPNDIISIDNISEILVNKLKSITDCGYVTIIGESWGGIIALKMAQMLELQGTFVTVTLLEGDPKYLTWWAEKFLSSNNITNKLYSIYTNENVSRNCVEVNKIPNETSLNKSCEDKTEQALKIIRCRLQVLLESKPLLNKLHTKVLIVRYKRKFEFYLANLNEYCTSSSFVHIIPKMDYKSMMADKETIDAITNNVAISYSDGIELPLIEKYNNFYFNVEKFIKYID